MSAYLGDILRACDTAFLDAHFGADTSLDSIEQQIRAGIRTETLREAAAEVVASCPDHGQRDEAWMDCHCIVGDWLLLPPAAVPGEKDTAPAATSTHQHTPRERHLLLAKAIRAEGGEWTPHRVHKLYRAHGITGLFRVTVRRDLAELCRDGHLVLHDQDPGRRYYTPKDGA